jgi:imidazolonepropionase-like amidohydrolase
VSAGLSPMEALRTATLRAAEFLAVQHDFGSVEEGKVANLVLLDENPADDIRNTQKIRAVILRGRFLDRENLDKLLAREKASVARQ